MSIPKIIHYCWLGGNEKPECVKKCISSWRKYCPDYEIKEWNESNLDIKMNLYTAQAYEARAWGFVPDYLRLWIVYTYGGIYLDTDVQIVKSFDKLLEQNVFMGFEDEEHVNLGLGFGACQGNALLKRHMEMYETISFINEDGSFNRTPSPYYTTELLKSFGLKQCDGEIQDVVGANVYPPEYFCPKSFKTGMTNVTKETYSIHQFDASWYSEEEQKKKLQYWKEARRDYWIHFPNRIVRKIFGDKRIDDLKKILGR